ncbi:hypothetical protein ACP70R_046840 [Stipagrostis hirtigluma subsp. patula]
MGALASGDAGGDPPRVSPGTAAAAAGRRLRRRPGFLLRSPSPASTLLLPPHNSVARLVSRSPAVQTLVAVVGRPAPPAAGSGPSSPDPAAQGPDAPSDGCMASATPAVSPSASSQCGRGCASSPPPAAASSAALLFSVAPSQIHMSRFKGRAVVGVLSPGAIDDAAGRVNSARPNVPAATLDPRSPRRSISRRRLDASRVPTISRPGCRRPFFPCIDGRKPCAGLDSSPPSGVSSLPSPSPEPPSTPPLLPRSPTTTTIVRSALPSPRSPSSSGLRCTDFSAAASFPTPVARQWSADGHPSKSTQADDFPSPLLKLHIAKEVVFRLDMAQEKRELSVEEISLRDDLKSMIPNLEASLGEDAIANPRPALESTSCKSCGHKRGAIPCSSSLVVPHASSRGRLVAVRVPPARKLPRPRTQQEPRTQQGLEHRNREGHGPPSKRPLGF